MTDLTLAPTVAVSKLPASRVSLAVSFPVALVEKIRPEAIRRAGAELSIPGFRKGKAPEKTIVAHLGEAAIQAETIEILLSRSYPEMVQNEKLDVIGHPDVTITKLEAGAPVEATIAVDVMPVTVLPDYRACAKSVTQDVVAPVTDEEVLATIDEARKMRAEDKEAALPPLSDEDAKTLGGVDTVDMLKEEVRSRMIAERSRVAKEKYRLALLDAVLEKTTLELPQTIIEMELDRMERMFSQDLARGGTTLEGYLAMIKKTKEEIRAVWKDTAEKRAKTEILIAEIAKVAQCTPPQEAIEDEMNKIHLFAQHIPVEQLRMHAESILTQDAVFATLEGVPLPWEKTTPTEEQKEIAA